MSRFDLDDFIANVPPDPSRVSGPRPSLFAPYLQYLEDDIPDELFDRTREHLARLRAAGTPVAYLEGLCCLHANDHAAALELFSRSIAEWPAAANPRLHYVITAYEMAPPLDSEEAYRRGFYVRSLARGVPSPHTKALEMLDGVFGTLRSGEAFTASSVLAEAAAMSRGFYPNELLLLKGYAAQGRNEVTAREVETRRETLLRRYPRLAALGGGLYRFAAES